MSSAYHPRRRALTLIELLVVIALILVIAALAAAFLPRLNRDTQLTNGANSIQSWLLGSKMRAKRDGLPTGVRLYVEPGASRGSVYNLQYVQQLREPEHQGDAPERQACQGNQRCRLGRLPERTAMQGGRRRRAVRGG